MSDFHERRGEEDDIGWMEADTLRPSFPLDCPHVSVRVSMPIHEESKRVVDKQELALGRSEYA